MNDLEDLIRQLPMEELSDMLGADKESIEGAVRSALPALVGGMQANAQDPGGANSLMKALSRHAGDQTPNTLQDIDTEDGAKIVHHIFGSNESEVASLLDGKTGGGGLVQKLLPMLAPLILAWLGKKVMGNSSSGGGGGGGGLGDLVGDVLGGGKDEASSDGGGIGDLLDSLSGGSQTSPSGGIGDLLDSLSGGSQGGAPSSGGGIGDLLGGLLGGGGGQGGEIGDLLGGLLGGGRKG